MLTRRTMMLATAAIAVGGPVVIPELAKLKRGARQNQLLADTAIDSVPLPERKPRHQFRFQDQISGRYTPWTDCTVLTNGGLSMTVPQGNMPYVEVRYGYV